MMALRVSAAPPPRLLVINPNTNPVVTELVRQTIAEMARPDLLAVVVNPSRGPFSIESEQHREEAVPLVLDIIESSRAMAYDGYVIACFDDIGVPEARLKVAEPVLDLSEAGIRAAASFGRFAIITTVRSAIPRIEALTRHYGVAEQCCVLAAGIGVAEAAERQPQTVAKLNRTIARAVTTNDVQAILLGSGGLAGLSRRLKSSVPLVDGVVAAMEAMTQGHSARASHRTTEAE